MNSPNVERALRDLKAVVGRTGHRMTVPERLDGTNVKLTCHHCGRVLFVLFDVPCGYLVTGSAAGNACHCGRGF